MTSISKIRHLRPHIGLWIKQMACQIIEESELTSFYYASANHNTATCKIARALQVENYLLLEIQSLFYKQNLQSL